MNRREALKAGLASLLTALSPFKAAADPVVEAYVANGFVNEERVGDDLIETYAFTRGVLLVGDMTPGLLVADGSFSVTVRKVQPRCDVSGLFTHLLGPYPIMQATHDIFGDWERSKTSFWRLGLLKTDKTSVWFKISKPLFTQIGVSVVARVNKPGQTDNRGDEFVPQFPGDDGTMMVTEWANFMSCEEPKLCPAPKDYQIPGAR